MAEDQAAEHATGASRELKRILGQKVGPLPMWAWVGIAAVIVLYIKQKQSGGSLFGVFGNKGTGSAIPNQQTDPAGNIGTIDPATGYVYGTPEDTAALAANNGGTGTGNGTPPPTSQTYADNNAWGRAAVNYLVGLGTDPTQAGEAIQQYLASQQLTTQQQADVNLAIQALGPPPQLPGPVGTPPPGVVPPPGGGGTGTAVVPNVVGKNAGEAHNALVSAGFVPIADPGQKATWKVTSTTPAGGTTQPKGTRVLITASAVTKPPTPGGSTGGHGGGGHGGGTQRYTVVKGDTLSGIAAKFHYPGGWQALYAANRKVIGPNPNLIKPGEVLTV